jgi:hypothetical protein
MSWHTGKTALAVGCIGDSNAYASGGFTPPGGQTTTAGLYCYASASGQVPYSEANLGWRNLDPNGTARTAEYASYLATTYATDAYIGQGLGGNGNPAMQTGAVLKTGTTIDTYLYQSAVGGTTADYWANGNGWDTLARTIPAALAAIPGLPKAFDCLLFSLGVNDAIQGATVKEFYSGFAQLLSKMINAGWWAPGTTQIVILDTPKTGYFGETFGNWQGLNEVLAGFQDRIARTNSAGYGLDPAMDVHFLPESYTDAGQQAGELLLEQIAMPVKTCRVLQYLRRRLRLRRSRD